MDTHFARAERLTGDDLARDIQRVSDSHVIDGLLGAVSGLLAVLNENRQIVALNSTLLDALGLDNAEDALGLRPGEAVGCVHASDMPAGCGTSEYCATCGAVIAIVTSLASDKPEEQLCAISAEKDGVPCDMFFRVRVQPIRPGDSRYLPLFLQDVTKEQEWRTLEKLFYHDVNNIVGGLVGKSELLQISPDKNEHARDILEWSLRLSREIEIHRSLFQSGMSSYSASMANVPLGKLIREIDQTFSAAAVTQGKRLILPTAISDVMLNTDLALLTRVVGNMITNALEATDEGGLIRMDVSVHDTSIVLSVWNEGEIPPRVQKRLFQRNFSTKNGVGRGLGTYSMRLFGEGLLKGSVNFTSSINRGTEFSITLKR